MAKTTDTEQNDRTKVHGREDEFDILLNVYERNMKEDASDTRKSEIALVTAPSGTGKSFFVNESMAKIIAPHKGYFVAGKCIEIQRHQPFACIVDALSMLTRILTEKEGNDSHCERIKESFLELNNDEGRILTDLIPELEDVIGRQNQEILRLSGQERQIRRNRVFRCFFQAVTACFPLVLFLDDLQWVDDSSLDLIHSLVADGTLNRFMLIGSFRDIDKVSKLIEMPQTRNDRDRLNKYFCQLSEKDDVKVTQIHLTSLSLSATISIVASNLCIPETGAHALASFINEYTQGNAMFTIELLEYLQGNNFISSSPDTAQLKREIEEIRASTHIPCTLEAILVTKFKQMPSQTRDLLTRAALVGNYFDSFVLKIVTSTDFPLDDSFATIPSFEINSSVDSLLNQSEESRFVQKIGCLGHEFCHDQLWKVAYQMLQEESRNQMHLHIGRELVKAASSSSTKKHTDSRSQLRKSVGLTGDDMESFLNRQLFVAVSQFNIGRHLVGSLVEKAHLISLNIRAAKLAIDLCAWKSAIEFINIGISLLEKNCWDDQYQLSLQLYTMGAKIEYRLDNRDKALSYANKVIQQRNGATTDQIAAYKIKIELLYLGNNNEALDLCLDVLDRLDIKFPRKIRSQRVQGWIDLQLTKMKYIPKEENIQKMPFITDIIIAHKMALLDKASACAFTLSMPDLYILIRCKSMRLMNEYGINESSGLGVASFANIMMHKYGDFKSAVKLAELALSIQGRFKSKFMVSRTINIVNGFVLGWVMPMKSTLKYLEQAEEYGLASGNTGAVVGSIIYKIVCMNFAATPNQEMEREACKYIRKEKGRDSLLVNFLSIILQFALNLMGKSPNTVILTGKAMNEEDVMEEGPICIAYITILKSALYAYFGDFEGGAEDALERGDSVAETFLGICYGFEPFFRGISLIAMARKTNLSKYKIAASKIQLQIKKYVEKGCVNLISALYLLQAEEAAFDGRGKKARAKYGEAISIASKSELHNIAALASERFAEYLVETDDISKAQNTITLSIQEYTKWGANAKVEIMKQKLQNLLTKVN